MRAAACIALSVLPCVAGCGLPAPPLLASSVEALLQAEIAGRAFPGAVALVTRHGEVECVVAAGRETYAADAQPVRADTRFDLASLTKVCATLPALLLLVERGSVGLDDRVVQWLPGFRGGGKDAVTLRHLMTHSSGLPAYRRLYRQLRGKAEIVAAAIEVPLTQPPGEKTVYSDLGVILLMAVVEKASGLPFDRFLATEVYSALGVEAVFARSGHPIAAAPTERDSWRGRLVHGEVHDENAFAMGGVSGHAGLFATAADVARLGNLFLRGGEPLFSPPLVRQVLRRDTGVAGSTRALLFDTYTPRGSGGSKLSSGAFGHTGFTGTSLWCDPATGLCMVLLTNRVHPSRANQRIRAARRAFHDLVVDCLARRDLP